jgi:ribosome-associated protein
MRKQKKPELSSNLLSWVVKTMQEKKGNGIVSLNLKKINNAVTDYFVICHADSRTQVDAIADNIIEILSHELAVKPYHYEGFENSEWILIDYVDVVVHVFLTPIRTFYQLEDLWADAVIVNHEE